MACRSVLLENAVLDRLVDQRLHLRIRLLCLSLCFRLLELFDGILELPFLCYILLTAPLGFTNVFQNTS